MGPSRVTDDGPLEPATRGEDAPAKPLARPLVYDATHLVTRLSSPALSGIDWVDRIYARHFFTNARLDAALHYGLFSPHLFAPARVGAVLRSYDEKLADVPLASDRWRRLRAWLTGRGNGMLLDDRSSRCSPMEKTLQCGKILGYQSAARLAHDLTRQIPQGAIYLNIAQHAFEYHALFSWLERRPDLVPAFFVHDLLPLDYPEFFPAGYKQRFQRRVETIIRYSRALITSSACTAERIAAEFAAHGRPMVPIHVAPLPSPLDGAGEAESIDPVLANSNYFVLISTIEPRKNHLMLLEAWRSLLCREGQAPKLAAVGLRGWNSSQTMSVFERSTALRPFVRRVSGLSPSALRALVANARALLMPSFAEGYGLPLVEAMSLGTPVVASDIPVFREATQGRATFISPLNGAAWRDKIFELAAEDSEARRDAIQRAKAFSPPTWAGYFKGVEAFLASL